MTMGVRTDAEEFELHQLLPEGIPDTTAGSDNRQ